MRATTVMRVEAERTEEIDQDRLKNENSSVQNMCYMNSNSSEMFRKEKLHLRIRTKIIRESIFQRTK